MKIRAGGDLMSKDFAPAAIFFGGLVVIVAALTAFLITHPAYAAWVAQYPPAM
jgi:hypothetical protein